MLKGLKPMFTSGTGEPKAAKEQPKKSPFCPHLSLHLFSPLLIKSTKDKCTNLKIDKVTGCIRYQPMSALLSRGHDVYYG